MLQGVETEQAPRSQFVVVGSGFRNPPVEQSRDQPMLIDSQPRPACTQILAADDPRTIAERSWRKGRAIEEFVTVRRDYHRIVREDTEVDCKRAHALQSSQIRGGQHKRYGRASAGMYDTVGNRGGRSAPSQPRSPAFRR